MSAIDKVTTKIVRADITSHRLDYSHGQAIGSKLNMVIDAKETPVRQPFTAIVSIPLKDTPFQKGDGNSFSANVRVQFLGTASDVASIVDGSSIDIFRNDSVRPITSIGSYKHGYFGTEDFWLD